jgi:hypothetical protein
MNCSRLHYLGSTYREKPATQRQNESLRYRALAILSALSVRSPPINLSLRANRHNLPNEAS